LAVQTAVAVRTVKQCRLTQTLSYR